MKDGATPKLVDVADCTGAGDVDVSTEVDAEWVSSSSSSAKGDGDDRGQEEDDVEKGYWQVEGLTGRTLKLNSKWKIRPEFPVPIKKEVEKDDEKEKDEGGGKDDDKEDETGVAKKDAGEEKEDTKSGGEGTDKAGDDKSAQKNKKTVKVRIGMKRAYELFPRPCTSRVKDERTKQFRLTVESEYAANVRTKLAEIRSRISSDDKPTPEQSKELKEYEARLEALNDKKWTDDDAGPVFDCVCFWDGQDYRAVVDVEETGDLVGRKPMTSYHKERQYETFGVVDQLNYAVNFYHDCTVLSIVCDSSPHGTHVAAIAAAASSKADQGGGEERCGVAPGAELVGLVIGDVRLGTMETGAALARAMSEAVRLKCDVVNLSFGEGSCVSDKGRFVELAEELVWKHNVVFVSSAGNNGPGLSSVGAPGGTSSAIIGVAAHVSPDMMKAEYSLPLCTAHDGKATSSDALERDGELYAGSTFTWSSVGPTDDGATGVDITAPGGAIASVPHWCLQKTRLMNGTSMSSPNATGTIALLISACKAEGIPVSTMRIRRAIENTAKTLPTLTPLQQGWGMIQAMDAFEYLKNFKDVDTEDINFHVCVENRTGTPRGIYLRTEDEASTKRTFAINVDPQFRREDIVSEETQKKKINLEMTFNIGATVPWVTTPSYFALMNGGRTFKIEVDPTGLSSGVHTARVCGYDATNPERKVIFSVPITVVKPITNEREFSVPDLQLQPSQVERYFLVPPPGSTWMDISVRDLRDSAADGDTSTRIVVLHTTQLLPYAAYRDNEFYRYMTLLPSQEMVSTIAVQEGVTIEVTVARLWNTIGNTKVSFICEFRGVRPSKSVLHMVSGDGGSLVRLYSNLKDESINPKAKLTKWRSPLRPKNGSIVSPLTDRDVLPPYKEKVYQLVLSYEYSQESEGQFTIRCPMLDQVLYESVFENHVFLVFDDKKKFLGASSNFPTSVSATVKGTIRLQVRHKDPKKLEDLKQLCIWIERNLEKEITLDVYNSREALMYSDAKFRKMILRKDAATAAYISEPAVSKLPSAAKNGDLLLGSVTYGGNDSNLAGEGKRPGGFLGMCREVVLSERPQNTLVLTILTTAF